MPQTFLAMTIYVVVAAIVGLLVVKYARWRTPEESARPGEERASRGAGCAVALGVALLAAVLVLLWLWGRVALPH